MIPIVNQEYADEVCKMGQEAACCRYLMAGPDGLECAKSPGNEGFRALLRTREGMTAQGDNCNGYRMH